MNTLYKKIQLFLLTAIGCFAFSGSLFAQFDYMVLSTKYVPGCTDYSHGFQSGMTAHAFSGGCIQVKMEVHKTGQGGGCTGGPGIGCKIILRRVDDSYDPNYSSTTCRANPWLDGAFAEQSSGTLAFNSGGISMSHGGCNGDNDIYYYTIGSGNGNYVPPGRYTLEVRCDDYNNNAATSSWQYASCNNGGISGNGGLYYFTVGTAGVFREILVADTKVGGANTEYYFDKALQPGNDMISTWTISGSGTAGALCQNDPFLLGFELNTYKNTDRGGNILTPRFKFWIDTPATDVGSSGSPISANIPFRDNCTAGSPGWSIFSGGGSCVNYGYGSNDEGYQDVLDQRWQISPDNANSTAANIGGAPIVVTSSLLDIAQMIKNANGGIMPAGSYTINVFTETDWQGTGCAGTCIITSSPTISRSFTVTSEADCIQLPVELSQFDVQAQGRRSLLTWTTSSEANSAFFEVERSADNLNFVSLARVAAAGNSTSVNRYQFTDNQPLKGMNYYRLRQVDTDNSFIYSRTLTLRMGAKSIIKMAFLKDNTIYLNTDFTQSQNTSIKVYDVLGRSLFEKSLFIQDGNAYFEIPAQGIDNNGVYFLTLKDSFGASQTVKLTKN